MRRTTWTASALFIAAFTAASMFSANALVQKDTGTCTEANCKLKNCESAFITITFNDGSSVTCKTYCIYHDGVTYLFCCKKTYEVMKGKLPEKLKMLKDKNIKLISVGKESGDVLMFVPVVDAGNPNVEKIRHDNIRKIVLEGTPNPAKLIQPNTDKREDDIDNISGSPNTQKRYHGNIITIPSRNIDKRDIGNPPKQPGLNSQ